MITQTDNVIPPKGSSSKGVQNYSEGCFFGARTFVVWRDFFFPLINKAGIENFYIYLFLLKVTIPQNKSDQKPKNFLKICKMEIISKLNFL